MTVHSSLAFSSWRRPRDAQSFDWPTAAQQSRSQSAPAAADAAALPCSARLSRRTLTAPPNTPARRHPRPCLAAMSVSSAPRLWVLNWTLLTRRNPSERMCWSPLTLLAFLRRPFGHPSSAVRHCLPGPPGFPPPPSLAVPLAPQPHDFVPPSSKAMPPHKPQTRDVSTAQAGKLNASQPPSLQKQDATTAQTGKHNAPLPASTRMSDASIAQAGKQASIRNADRTGCEPFSRSRRLLCSLCHALLSAGPVCKWNPGPARKNPTQILPAACGRFHAVILQEAGDHVPHVSDHFHTYIDGNDLSILPKKDTF